MTTLYKILPAFAAIAILLFSSCKKDDPEIPNEEELITTLIYTLTPESGGDDIVMTFRDIDGEGGTDPTITITGAPLMANTTYDGSIQLLNETEAPAEDITLEVKEEDLDHQFFFNTSGGLDLNVDYSDQDGNGNPLGVLTEAVAGSASQGQLTIILRHEPDKTATGVADGDITNAGGESDIEVTFDLSIQ